MKTCNKCGIAKPLTYFSKKKKSKDGHYSRCKECDKEATRLWRKNNPEKSRISTERWNEDNADHVRDRQKSYYARNSETIMAQQKEFLKSNPDVGLWRLAKRRCKKSGVPFDITSKDIVVPEVCPILGIKLEFGEMQDRDSSPSLDRIIPELGYVVGNIAVISFKANRIKNHGSSDEHRKIADWMDSFQ